VNPSRIQGGGSRRLDHYEIEKELGVLDHRRHVGRLEKKRRQQRKVIGTWNVKRTRFEGGRPRNFQTKGGGGN